MERILTKSEVASAALIQEAIDSMAATGGKLVLPAMDLEIDRGLRLHTGVTIEGQGADTVLRKGPGRVYPLTGYHNYGMRDVPIGNASGLETGMTVSIHDDLTHGNFYETFATIVAIEDGWVRLDRGIEADYLGHASPCLTTAYPLIYGLGVGHAGVRNLRLEGNRGDNEKAMGACRGSAVYFCQSHQLEVKGITQVDYHGEGMGFQMCRDVAILDSTFDNNSGNGLHPGAGSTNALFDGCGGSSNDQCGFFFCVRANHITVRDCTFRENSSGVSIGTRDCNNLIEDCTIENNREPGILTRGAPRPTEVHTCEIRDSWISGNAVDDGRGQIEITGDAHHMKILHNRISGSYQRQTAGVFLEPTVRDIYLMDNMFENCMPEVAAPSEAITGETLHGGFGFGTGDDAIFGHLEPL